LVTAFSSAIIILAASACGHSTGGGSTESDKPQTDQATKKTDHQSAANQSTANDSSEKADLSDAKSESGTNNIKNVKGFTPIENQSFTVNLNSWGKVQFVAGKITGGTHVPTVFYLTNENGDILYSFDDAPFPYDVDVKAVSFQDVNKDGLKDGIIIVSDHDNSGKPIAAVWLQSADKKFACDTKLSQKINESGNNQDIKTVTDYLSKKIHT